MDTMLQPNTKLETTHTNTKLSNKKIDYNYSKTFFEITMH